MGLVPSPSLLILLVEDDRHQQFIYQYLRKLGYRRHEMRIVKSPSGEGSGEQWVRDKFPGEVEACRRRQAETKLIVLIDADTYTVHQRKAQLNKALRDAGRRTITDSATEVLLLTPKRNIETWILCLSGEQVDEDTDYKKIRADWSGLLGPALDTLHLWTRPGAAASPSCVESLQAGIQELQKLNR